MTERKKIEPDPRGQVIAKVELKKIGNSSGVILPKEVMARLNLVLAINSHHATLTPEGGLRLTPYDPDFRRSDEHRPDGA